MKMLLGDMLAPPPRFEPTEQFADRLYLYRIDRERGICKLTILDDSATRPAGFYAIKTPQPRPIAQLPHPDQTEMVAVKAPTPPTAPRRERPSIHVSIPKVSLAKLQLPKLKLPAVKLPKVKVARRTTKFTKRTRTGARKSLVAVMSTAATAAAFLVVYPMYPQIRYNINQTIGTPQTAVSALASTPVSSGNELRIPKIGVRTAILESDSLEILNKKEGVWHQAGTLNADNFVLAGHRWKYLPPNTSTFYNLNKLVVGDTIVIDWFQKRYLFTVKQVLTVSQTRTDLIQPTATPRITLYTCSDKEETERIVVVAEPEL